MKHEFKEFSENIRLTSIQQEDAKTKYDGVCKTLHKKYYENNYDGKTKLLFGSYKTKTNTRPLDRSQDVDVIFKITQETFDQFNKYDCNGQSALLQEIRNCLLKTYTTSVEPKAWGKIVLVQFSDGHHNVEVLPGLEQCDGTFLIPNTENGGSWEVFNPRKQLDEFSKSNDATNGLTADITRMAKTWVKSTASLTFESFYLLSAVIDFLNNKYPNGAGFDDYHYVVKDLFTYLQNNCKKEIKSHVETALKRATNAVDYINVNKPKEASEEYRKIFGDNFPLVMENPVQERTTRVFATPSSPYVKL